jgi:hypothetical protein
VVADQNTDTPASPPMPETPAPAPSGRAARLGWGVKEMSVAVGVLVVVIVGLALITNTISFNPGGPSTDAPIGGPVINENQQFQLAAGQLRFPLHEPKLPSGWHPNSADLDPVGPTATNGQPNSLRIGFITPAGRYVSIAESSAAVIDLAREAAGTGGDAPMSPKGTVDVAGKTWTIYQGTRSEVSWGLDLGAVRMLISGNGSQAEFTTMATAVQTAPVTPAPGS